MVETCPVALSVVIRVVGGGDFLGRCLRALQPQVQGCRIEIIVPYDAEVQGIERLKPEFPEAIFVDGGEVQSGRRRGWSGSAHAWYDRRTARGFCAARGDIVASLEDHQIPDPDWCQQLIEAHRLPHAAIGGCVEHGGSGLASWASYFLDFGRYQLPFAEGPSDYLSDVNLSYKRAALESVRGLWQERYREVTVNWALAERGETLWRTPRIVVRMDRGRCSLPGLLVERFFWGRLFAALRVKKLATGRRFLYALASPAIAVVLLARVVARTSSGADKRKWLVLAFPHLVALTLSWCAGECVGYLSGREGKG